MNVVSNTSPLLNLAAIGRADLLRELYGPLTIPEAVREELEALSARQTGFPSLLPVSWIDVHAVANRPLVSLLSIDLHSGEAEAIALAIELQVDLLLMDEQIGRRVASRLDLPTMGLLGTLIHGKREGLISLVRPIMDQLKAEAGFWIDDDLYMRVLEEAHETY